MTQPLTNNCELFTCTKQLALPLGYIRNRKIVGRRRRSFRKHFGTIEKGNIEACNWNFENSKKSKVVKGVHNCKHDTIRIIHESQHMLEILKKVTKTSC